MQLSFRNFFSLVILLVVIIPNMALATTFAARPEVKTFIQQMVTKHGFKQSTLTKLFNQFETSTEIIQKISKPYEEQPWHHYRKVFITEQRILEGVEFWQQHASTLEQAEKTFGVPAEIIVSIIGVETFYGKNKGQYPVLQALATLAFDYPKRAEFFKSELEQYLLLTKEQNLPAAQIKGSYAGAMGYPQFISSSYRNFAIDFAKVGTIDLINNVTNAIGSVANYFKIHGWQTNKPIINKATTKGHKYTLLKLADMRNPKPNLSLSILKKHNVYINTKNKSLAPSAQFAFIQLDTGKNKEYWLGHDNFYVITRYNHSVHYAMAVYELSQQILKQYNQHLKGQ